MFGTVTPPLLIPCVVAVQGTDAGGFDARLEREIHGWMLALGREWAPLSTLCVRLRAAKSGALLQRAEERGADGGAFIASLHAHVATVDNADEVLREVDGTMEWGETAERVLGGAVDAWALSAAPQRRASSGEEWPQQQ